MATRDNSDDWDAIEGAVRAALVEAGLADLVRELDESAQQSDDDEGLDQPDANASARVLELLAAAERFFAGRAALATSATAVRRAAVPTSDRRAVRPD